jgi:D-3-phosphoglycerate dehydrogenase
MATMKDLTSMRSTRSLAAGRPLIVLAAGTFSEAHLEQARVGRRATVEVADLGSRDKVRETTELAAGVIVTNNPFPRELVDALGPRVRILTRAGIGLDAIDLAAVAHRGITVINLPGYATDEVATHAVALMLAVARRLKESDEAARSHWSQWRGMGEMRSIEESVVGIVGCGRIGAAVIRRMAPFTRSIIAYDSFATKIPRPARLVGSLEELLGLADIVSLHLPLTPATSGLLGAQELSLMRPGAILVNVARGSLVDQAALAAALTSGHLGGAALDVLVEEPPQLSDAILQAPNTLITPHVGWYSTRSERRVREQAIDDTLNFLSGRQLRYASLVTGPHTNEV